MKPTERKWVQSKVAGKLLERPSTHAPRFKPVVAQLKTAMSAQSVKRPVAPIAFRPPATPKAVQPKMANVAVNRKLPVAPPVYRPQQTPKVLQTKRSPGQSPHPGHAPRQPVAPPVHRLQPQPTAMQPKRADGQRSFSGRLTQQYSVARVPRPLSLPGKARIIQRMKLSDFNINKEVLFSEFKNSKSGGYYMLIKSSRQGWHLTIPVNKKLKPDEMGNYEFYKYHVTDESSVDNVHYHYDAKHQQEDTDGAMGKAKWAEADAVVREIFGVTPQPKHKWLQLYRMNLMAKSDFVGLGKFNQAVKKAAKSLTLSEAEVEGRLNDESARDPTMKIVSQFL